MIGVECSSVYNRNMSSFKSSSVAWQLKRACVFLVRAVAFFLLEIMNEQKVLAEVIAVSEWVIIFKLRQLH